MDKIVVQPGGGLANQMVIYAAALALAERLQCDLEIDLMSYHYRVYKNRPYSLKYLKVPQNIAPSSKWLRIPVPIIRRICFRIERKLVFHDNHFHYDKRIENVTSPVTMTGFFASWRYFDHIRDKLLEIFQPAEPLSPSADEWKKKINGAKNSVCIHIRRGDYLSANAHRVHGVLDIDYYLRAEKIMSALIDRPRYFFFSDDREWVEKNIMPVIPGELVQTDAERPWEDMHLMTLCMHNIIANSGFSWWGSYLSEHKDKVVIAPRQWFTPEQMREYNCCDLFPHGWISI